MSAHAVLNDPQTHSSHPDLHQELAPAILEKCRELVAEYSALATADPAAFPFTERDLLDWYGDIKSRVSEMIADRMTAHRENRVVAMPRRVRRGVTAA